MICHAPHGGIWRLATGGLARDFFLSKSELGYSISNTVSHSTTHQYVFFLVLKKSTPLSSLSRSYLEKRLELLSYICWIRTLIFL